LSAENSNKVPDKDFLGVKVIDSDQVDIEWQFVRVKGHSQPIKLLSDVADWIAAMFERVNK